MPITQKLFLLLILLLSTNSYTIRILYDDNCATWDPQTGKCQTCKAGYGDSDVDGMPIQGQCPVYEAQTQKYTANCMKWDDDTLECYRCATGYGDDPYYGKPVGGKCDLYVSSSASSQGVTENYVRNGALNQQELSTYNMLQSIQNSR